jgi:hypothetical protein
VLWELPLPAVRHLGSGRGVSAYDPEVADENLVTPGSRSDPRRSAMAVTQMSETPAYGWLKRPSLARRIGLAMVLSLVAIQAQAFLQIRLLSQPKLHLTGTRWLAEATRTAATAAFAVPAAERNELLRAKSGNRIDVVGPSYGRPA